MKAKLKQYAMTVWNWTLRYPAALVITLVLVLGSGLLMMFGVGVAAFQAPNNSSIMGAVEKERLGTASALLATQRQVGLSLGMAITGSLYTAKKAGYLVDLGKKGMEAVPAMKNAIAFAFHDSFIVAACFMIGAVVFSLATWQRKEK